MARTGDAVYAAEKAGYPSPAQRASQNTANPALMESVRQKSLARVENEVLPLAVDRHVELLRDKLVTGTTLTRALDLAYKYGFAARDDAAQKEPCDMTPAELAASIASLRMREQALLRMAADKASPVLELEANDPGVFD